MKLRFKKIILISNFIFIILLTSSCSDKKNPKKGFVDADIICENSIQNFQTINYSEYKVNGSFNFFGMSDDETLGANNISKKYEFVDSTNVYSTKCDSYYLSVPLHVTLENWNTTEILESNSLPASTKYQLESKIIRPSSLDKVYYYMREDGGFEVRTFAVNKGLLILNKNNQLNANCHAKWNISITYDKNGYLIKEEFATINAKKDSDSKTVYGLATYEFLK